MSWGGLIHKLYVKIYIVESPAKNIARVDVLCGNITELSSYISTQHEGLIFIPYILEI